MSRRDELRDRVPGAKVKKALMGTAAALVVLLVLALLVQTRGPLATTLYVFVFLFCLALMPMLIWLFGNSFPGSASTGRLHIILGAVAFDHHYLVQRDNEWEWCPGERGQVYIDGEWHDVEGQENYSILGWRPFGILRYKDKETWADKRADTKAERLRGATATDGGEGAGVERGGWTEAEQPLVTGIEGTWLVDLKRVYTRGVKKIGDIELIETAEEIIERGQVNASRFSNWKPFIETGFGLLLGVITGYAYILLA